MPRGRVPPAPAPRGPSSSGMLAASSPRSPPPLLATSVQAGLKILRDVVRQQDDVGSRELLGLEARGVPNARHTDTILLESPNMSVPGGIMWAISPFLA